MARIYIGVGSNIEREHYLRAGWSMIHTRYPPSRLAELG